MAASMLKPYARQRMLLAMAISLLPLNGLRVGLYRRLMGYDLAPGARIGLMTVIACESFKAGRNLVMGRNNRFVGPLRVEFGEQVIVGRFNLFSCGTSAGSPDKAHMNYARRITAGDGVLINDNHFFDVYGALDIGARTWVAGMGSQFWTHGASVMERDIRVGAGCYLGSAVRLAPGAEIGDRCVLGIGSVVVSRLAETDAVLAGFPAKKLRDITPEDGRQFVFEAS